MWVIGCFISEMDEWESRMRTAELAEDARSGQSVKGIERNDDWRDGFTGIRETDQAKR
jgi:hypothetical protein